MNKSPKKIWMADDCKAWAKKDAVFYIPYIRADIVDELVRALERCVPHVEDSFDDEHPHVIQARAALAKLEESHE